MATPVHALTTRARTTGALTTPGLGAMSRAARRRRAPRPVALALATAAMTASALAVLPTGSSLADPAPTVEQVQARLAELDLQVDQAVEDYEQAQMTLQDLRTRAAQTQADVAREQQEVARLQQQVGEVVAASYRGSSGGVEGFSLLTRSTSAQAYLEGASRLDQLAADQAERLAAVTAARARLDAALRQAQADVAAQQTVEQQAGQHRQAVESDLAASQSLLAGLQAQQRAQLAAAQAAAAAQQQAADAARSAEVARASRGSRPAGGPAPAAVPATGAAAVAVRAAYAELGSPYVWGAAGPSTFDCSGLTSFVWARAGVSLPHSSGGQYASLPHVAQSDVQPGDLVFFGSPIHHVGIYVGGGTMISAPHTGDVVKLQPAFRADYVGAARP